MFVSYFGMRVTNLERSMKFYTEVLGMRQVKTGDFLRAGGGRYVLLKDPVSGQQLELNWYPDGSRFATRYEPGEGLDHIGVKVQDVATKLRELASKGIGVVPVPDSLGEQKLGPTLTLHVGFVEAPDGNWIGPYDQSRRLVEYNSRLVLRAGTPTLEPAFVSGR